MGKYKSLANAQKASSFQLSAYNVVYASMYDQRKQKDTILLIGDLDEQLESISNAMDNNHLKDLLEDLYKSEEEIEELNIVLKSILYQEKTDSFKCISKDKNKKKLKDIIKEYKKDNK